MVCDVNYISPLFSALHLWYICCQRFGDKHKPVSLTAWTFHGVQLQPIAWFSSLHHKALSRYTTNQYQRDKKVKWTNGNWIMQPPSHFLLLYSFHYFYQQLTKHVYCVVLSSSVLQGSRILWVVECISCSDQLPPYKLTFLSHSLLMCYAICCDLVVPGLPSMRVTVPCELMSVNVALVSLLTWRDLE